MSLQKDSCERCWLPPLPGGRLCRKCKGTPPHELSRWIRYHTPSPAGCSGYRKIINEETYYGSVIPQDCLHCCNFLLRLNDPSWLSALKQHIVQVPCNELTSLLEQNIGRKRDLVLEYVDALLDFHQADTLTCKKIVNALVAASNNRATWVLEELVLRPEHIHTVLFAPVHLPSYIPEDFHGHFHSMENWWQFWERFPGAAQRRIKFRCLKFKEELIEKTWAPERVMEWCMEADARREWLGGDKR